MTQPLRLRNKTFLIYITLNYSDNRFLRKFPVVMAFVLLKYKEYDQKATDIYVKIPTKSLYRKKLRLVYLKFILFL